jgi:REP element-mobilizing transposase RayT
VTGQCDAAAASRDATATDEEPRDVNFADSIKGLYFFILPLQIGFLDLSTQRGEHEVKMPKRGASLTSRQLELAFRSRGGARRGAGRKPAGAQAGVSHVRRPEFKARHPLHVTMKVRQGLPSLRHRALASLAFSAFQTAKQRLGAKLVHFSVQANHLHLIVEAEGRRALSRAMQGLAVRLARRLNARIGRRGQLFPDRYHARVLRTPLEVRRALLYVLRNHEHHAHIARAPSMDPLSSASYFDGFSQVDPTHRSRDSPVAEPSTWLLRIGWRRHGLLGPEERPS